MLSVSLLERTLEARDYDRLLRELADNGQVLPLSLRVSLGQSEMAPLALALRRLVELTYSPTDLSRRLVEKLLLAQKPDGTFLGDGEPGRDPLATAVVLSALSRVAREHPIACSPELDHALESGFAALGELQDCDGLFSAPADRSLADRTLTTAFVVSILGDVPRFRGAVRLHEIQQWFDQHDARLDRHTRQLWDLAGFMIHDLAQPQVCAA